MKKRSMSLLIKKVMQFFTRRNLTGGHGVTYVPIEEIFRQKVKKHKAAQNLSFIE